MHIRTYTQLYERGRELCRTHPQRAGVRAYRRTGVRALSHTYLQRACARARAASSRRTCTYTVSFTRL
eukprot:6191442-Pleurochrysis_carterae.AAC.1